MTRLLSGLSGLAGGAPWRVVAAVLALAVAAAAAGAGVADRLSPYGADDPGSESARAADALEAATGRTAVDSVVALVRTPGGPRSARGRSRLNQVALALAADPAIGGVTPPVVARDRRSAYVVASFRAGADQVAAVRRLRDGPIGEAEGVQLGGSAVVARAINEVASEDLGRGELMVLPILLFLSFLFFRSVVAALLPLLVALVAIVLTLAGLRAVNEVHEVSVFAVNLVSGLGLGLAIDYSLFMVARYREELARTGPGREALRRTMTTAGRTVLFSGVTVAAALAALLVFPHRFLNSMGIGGAMVALAAAFVALTLLPAVLALLGARVNALAPRRLRRAADAQARHLERGPWYRLTRVVMRRPLPIATVAALVLVLLAIPATRLELTFPRADVLPPGEEARVVAEALERDFPPYRTQPVIVTAATADAAAAERFAETLRSLPGVQAVAPPRRAGALVRIDVATDAPALTERSQEVVRDVRALGAPFPVAVAGQTAAFVDQKAALGDRAPLAVAILAFTTLAILFVMTGSLVLPVKALAMNALTLGATVGILVLIFQDGRLEGLLEFESSGAIESLQPPVILALAFALSTDYGVFLLGRIQEERRAGAGDREAVALGLQRTGRLVTAAAALFCVAIGALVTSRMVFVKVLGLGGATAVLLDATVVRALLFPALMAMLGPWNWWAPRPLRALHARIGLSEAGAPAPRRSAGTSTGSGPA